MPFSFRADAKTAAKIRRIAAATGRSQSAIAREAVAKYEPDLDVPAPGESTYDRLKPFIGIVDTGGANYSKDTHRKYRARLKRTHRARRAH